MMQCRRVTEAPPTGLTKSHVLASGGRKGSPVKKIRNVIFSLKMKQPPGIVPSASWKLTSDFSFLLFYDWR